jgi:hypothetical protein
MFFARKLSRHAKFTAGSVIAFALLAGACSSESSVGRVKNAALDVQGPITCTLGGPSPSGGIIVSLSADKNGDSIESAPVQWNGDSLLTRGLLSSFDPFKKWSEVNALVSAYRGGGKSDWMVPSRTQWSLIKTQVFASFGANDYFTSDVIQPGYQWGIGKNGNEILISSFVQMSVRMFVPFVSSKKQIHPACQPQQPHWRQRQQRQLFPSHVQQVGSAQSAIQAWAAALFSRLQSIPRAIQRFLKLHQRIGPSQQASLNMLELVLCSHQNLVKEEQLQSPPPIAGETRATGVFRQ